MRNESPSEACLREILTGTYGHDVASAIAKERPELEGMNWPSLTKRRTSGFEWNSATSGAGAIIVTLLLLLIFCAYVPLSSSIMTTGTVVVQGSVKTIQHSEGGIIDEIVVGEGDFVQMGDVLIHLDTLRAQHAMAALRSQIVLMAAQKARIRAELRNDMEIEFPYASHGVLLAEYNEMLTDQKRHFQARRSSLLLHLRSLDSDREQDNATIIGLQQQISSIELRSNLSVQEVAIANELARTGSGTRHAVRDSMAVSASLGSDLAGLKARATELMAHLSHTDLEMQRTLASFKEADEAELQQVTRDEVEIFHRFSEVSLSIERAEIRAPISGFVFNLGVHTVGGVVAPGAAILDIVPNAGPLLLESQIRPMDVEDVAVGSTVMMRAQGDGSARRQSVAGEVSFISADHLVDRNTGASYFLCRMKLDTEKFSALQGVYARPGILIDLMIAKKEKTLLSYLLSPILLFTSNALTE